MRQRRRRRGSIVFFSLSPRCYSDSSAEPTLLLSASRTFSPLMGKSALVMKNVLMSESKNVKCNKSVSKYKEDLLYRLIKNAFFINGLAFYETWMYTYDKYECTYLHF